MPRNQSGLGGVECSQGSLVHAISDLYMFHSMGADLESRKYIQYSNCSWYYITTIHLPCFRSLSHISHYSSIPLLIWGTEKWRSRCPPLAASRAMRCCRRDPSAAQRLPSEPGWASMRPTSTFHHTYQRSFLTLVHNEYIYIHIYIHIYTYIYTYIYMIIFSPHLPHAICFTVFLHTHVYTYDQLLLVIFCYIQNKLDACFSTESTARIANIESWSEKMCTGKWI